MKLIRAVVVAFFALAGVIAFAPAAQAAPPANDSIASATQLSGKFQIIDGTTVDSTTESLDPALVGSGANTSVWYRWTAPVAGRVKVDVCADSSTSSGVAITPEIGDSPPPLLAGNGDCRAATTVTAGTTLNFVVYAESTPSPFRLVMHEYGRPANDDFASAELLSGDTASTSGITTGATKEPGEPDHYGSTAEETVWYKWTPSADGFATVNSCYSDFEMKIAVYTGTSVGALTSVSESDCGDQFAVTAGTTYHVAVVPYNSDQSGSFYLHVELANSPSNDDFANAQVIPATGGEVDGNNAGATGEALEPPPDGEGSTVWYTWTPASDGRALIDACDESDLLDIQVNVFVGGSVGGLSFVAGRSCRFPMNVTGGTEYRIQVSSEDPHDRGEFTLRVTLPAAPANDDLADAIPITSQSFDQTGSYRGTTLESGESDPADNDAGSVWYAWTAPSSEEVTIDNCGSDFDTYLGIYTGSSFPLDEVGRSDDSSDEGCGLHSAYTFTPTAGTTYKIGIYAYSDFYVGTYRLRIYPGPLQPLKHTITAATAGTGSGTVFTTGPGRLNCGAICSEQVNDDYYVYVQAVADEGSVFLGWQDEPTCPGTVRCYQQVDSDVTVTAIFKDVADKTLTVNKQGDGSGTVSSNPAGIDCGSTCSHVYGIGTTVSLSATADPGSKFAGWSGACSGTGACQVTMDQATDVSATFTTISTTTPAFKLKIGKATLNRKKGTARLAVTVNAAAKIILTGKGIKKKTLTARKAKTVRITVVSTGKLKKKLRKKRKAVAKLKVTARPTAGGKSVTKRAKVTLKLKKKKKKRH